MALRPDLVGQRVVVRQVVPGELGPTGGPAFTDVLGELVAWTPEELTVRRKDDSVVVVDQSLVVTAKPVPPRPSVRQRITADDLELICAAGWRPVQQLQLGDWLLRAAGGFTGRANSVLPVGSPGLPVDQAIERVVGFYVSHELPPRAQVIVDSEAEAAFVAHGWVAARPSQPPAVVQVASVAQALRRAASTSGNSSIGVVVKDQPDENWMTRYGRTRGIDAAVIQAVVAGGPNPIGFAHLGDPLVAIGRAVVVGDWVGLSAVEVDPAQRRRGRGQEVVRALLDWAAAQGAMSAYLQTLPDNEAASALYAGYGFQTHHSYRYLTPTR
jgi:ribosomal protein S18 acetylase RimI-like enzyme